VPPRVGEGAIADRAGALARRLASEEALGEIDAAVCREVHREKSDVGADVAAPEALTELDAVDDRELAFVADIQVLEAEVAVTIADAAGRDAPLERARAIAKEVELARLDLARLGGASRPTGARGSRKRSRNRGATLARTARTGSTGGGRPRSPLREDARDLLVEARRGMAHGGVFGGRIVLGSERSWPRTGLLVGPRRPHDRGANESSLRN
jgi:hypothetical protein